MGGNSKRAVNASFKESNTAKRRKGNEGDRNEVAPQKIAELQNNPKVLEKISSDVLVDTESSLSSLSDSPPRTMLAVTDSTANDRERTEAEKKKMEHLEGVDYDRSIHEHKCFLNELPFHDDPRLPSTDELKDIRDEGLQHTYSNLCLLPYVPTYIQFGRGSDKLYHGIAYSNMVRNTDEMVKDFIQTAIEFKCADTRAINLSRVNAYDPKFSAEPIEGDYINRENAVLKYDGEPALCFSVIVVVHSDLVEPRTINAAREQYVVKDAQGHLLKLESERLFAALSVIRKTDVMYVNGSAIGDPLISFSTNFTKMRTQIERARGKASLSGAIPPDDYELPKAKVKATSKSNEKAKVFLYPTDDVPIYDMSSLYFDFNSHFDEEALEDNFTRLVADPPANSRCLVAYYPSIWTKDGRNIVRFNIKWLGVIDV